MIPIKGKHRRMPWVYLQKTTKNEGESISIKQQVTLTEELEVISILNSHWGITQVGESAMTLGYNLNKQGKKGKCFVFRKENAHHFGQGRFRRKGRTSVMDHVLVKTSWGREIKS